MLKKTKKTIGGMLCPAFLAMVVAGSPSQAWAEILPLSPLLYKQHNQEKITVSGTVKDNTGTALAGVTVSVKGTQQGVSTDKAGSFRLENVPVSAVLVFHSIGYTMKEVPINGQKSIQVVLEVDNGTLEEVVVVGYGRQKKESVTGAIVQVDSKTLENRPISNIAQGLQGVVGNLNISASGGANGGGAPGSKPSINVRGFTGLGSTNGPLVVIDGVQGGDLNALNPNDVESVTLIKDAAAAAVYGSSAPYGVLLVTTKKGRKEGTPTISYSNNFTFGQPIGLPKMVNSLDFGTILNQARANAGEAPWFTNDVMQRIKDYQAGTLKEETIKDPNSDSWLSWGGANSNNDWYKIYFRDLVPSQQHNASISGGSKNTTYYVGMGYNKTNGLYRYGKDLYQKFNIRTNLSTDITSWLTFNFRGNFTKEITNSPNDYGGRTGENYMHQIARKHPNLALKNPTGLYSDASDILFQKEGGRNILINDLPILTGEFAAKLLPGWNATVNYTFDGSFYNESRHIKTLYDKMPSGTKVPMSWSFPNRFSRKSNYSQHQIVNFFTDYAFSLQKHNFKILAGYVNETTAFTEFGASNQQLYTDNVPALSLTYGSSPSISDNIYKLASRGVFGRLNYNYDEKYLLEVVGRYDGSSKFLNNVRWKMYPGISAGWNVHRENFWEGKLADVVNTLKLRGSYGTLGDQSLTGLPDDNTRIYPFYPNLQTVSPNNSGWFFAGGREASVSQPLLVNPTLSWVTTRTLDFGFDATFLKNRLSVQFDWYRRSMDNFIGPPEVLPAVFGAKVPRSNSAAIETKGYELTLSWRDKIGELGYGLRGVLSDYVGVVTRYPNPSGLLPNNNNKLDNNWYKGQRIGEIWGYETDRYFMSEADHAASPEQWVLFGRWGAGDIKYKDLNNDGKIDYGENTLSKPGDKTIIGNTTPRYSYSLFADVSWKNFDMSIFLQGVGKRDFFMPGNYFFGITDNVWQSSLFDKHLDRWTPETPNGYFPKAYTNAEMNKNIQAQTKYILNAAYMRIKNLQVGYTIQPSFLERIHLKKVRFYVSLDNLATFTKMSDHSALDPEIAFSDGKIYPLQRNYSFGLNLTL